MEYTDLEEFERNIVQIPFYTKEYTAEDGSFLGKRVPLKTKEKELGIPSSNKPKNYGYSFTVRPQSSFSSRELTKKLNKRQSDTVKHLSTIRKKHKLMF